MKAFFKYLGIVLLLLITIIGIVLLVKNEDLPSSEKSSKADVLANKMLEALNYDAYIQTRFIEWSFRGQHFYKWDKKSNQVLVSWNGNKVNLFTKYISKSKVLENPEGKSENDLIAKATKYFNNDSFWLIAPYKVFDPSVERTLVKLEDGKEALMVTYKSGGTTPGDSYVWFLDDHYIPTHYKMWVKILPIGGVQAGWSNWTKTSTGFMLPKSHKLLGTIDMGEIKAYN